MTAITKAQREEITIVHKDGSDIETLSFDDSGEIVCNVMNDMVKKTGRGVWYTDQSYVSIIVDLDKTCGTYEIENNFLTIITTEEDSDEYYGNKTILEDSKK